MWVQILAAYHNIRYKTWSRRCQLITWQGLTSCRRYQDLKPATVAGFVFTEN